MNEKLAALVEGLTNESNRAQSEALGTLEALISRATAMRAQVLIGEKVSDGKLTNLVVLAEVVEDEVRKMIRAAETADAIADAVKPPETVTVTLTGVNMGPGRNAGQIQTIKVLREQRLPEQNDGSYKNDLKLQRDLVWTVIGKDQKVSRYEKVSPVLTSRATPERARQIADALATVGATVEISPAV